MGIEALQAEHHTRVLAGSVPRLEVQLLKYLQPDALPDPQISRLDCLGFNHICFAVAVLDDELAKLLAHGFETRNEVMEFNDRKLVFLEGPEGLPLSLHNGSWLTFVFSKTSWLFLR